MTYLHIVNQEEDTVFIRAMGQITTEETIANMRKLGESQEVPNNLNLLIDLRESERVRNYDEAERIVDFYSYASGKHSRKVVLLALKTAIYGASRMQAALAQIKGYDVHAAKSEEEACELLGIKSIPSGDQFARDGFEI